MTHSTRKLWENLTWEWRCLFYYNLFLHKELKSRKNLMSNASPEDFLLDLPNPTLEKIVNLDIFFARKNEIDEINTILKGGKKLKALEDIEPLAHFKNLQHVFLNGNKIKNITPLSDLKKLEELEIDDNKVEDLSPLNQLLDLEELSFSNNAVSDLSPLSNHTKLGWVFFDDNQVADLTPLSKNKGINMLGASNNKIREVTIFKGNKELFDLQLDHNLIASADFLEEDFPYLKEINLSNNKLTVFPNLKGSINLKYAFFSNNRIHDISNLSKITHLEDLRTLHFAGNPIRDFSSFSCLDWITTINISNTGIKDLTPFKEYNYIRFLVFENNEVEDLTPIKNVDITGIYARNNKITEIEILRNRNFTFIATIDFSGNPISDLSPLENCTYLYFLLLFDIKITDFSIFSQFKYLEELGINHLSEEQKRIVSNKNPDCQFFTSYEDYKKNSKRY